MTVEDVVAALALPPESRVDQRVPKKLLVENGAPTAADKRQINDGIDELMWLAALKPANVGVPEYRDAVREAVEIAVLSLSLRPTAKAERLLELIHRAIPYPVLLVTAQTGTVSLSFANKRLSQNEAGKVVLDDAVVAGVLVQHAETEAFLKNLAVAAQPRSHLLAVYQGWIACLETFQAAQLTGRFVPPPNADAVSARREALAEHGRLQREMSSLRAQAQRESQVNRRVELNLAIKRLEARLADVVANL